MPSSTRDIVRQHYEAGIDDQEILLARLSAAINDMPRPLSTQSFASFDQFHIGGLKATAELARLVPLTADMSVLDAGSGLGGPSRYLAETFGCSVTGVDLAPSYVAIAALIAEKTMLASKVGYQAGSIIDLPFPDASFDVVWSQHVVMNIADRDGLYRELRRVLKPGGNFAFYDPYAPDQGDPPHYPVPWAETPDTSTLLTKSDTIAAMRGAGFSLVEWEDATVAGLEWLAGQQQQPAPTQLSMQTPSVLSTAMVVGPRMTAMVQNFGRNLREGRIRLVMGIAQAN